MTFGSLPLGKIFWTIFGIESAALAVIVAVSLMNAGKRGPTSGLESTLAGGWVVVLPVIAALCALGLFLAAKSPGLRLFCIAILLWPAIMPLLGMPVAFVKMLVNEASAEEERLGRHIFPEPGQRALATAIANHDVEGVKTAIPGAGDLNRKHSKKLPFEVPLSDEETFLTFACKRADKSDAAFDIVRLLLEAGANPNAPEGVALNDAIFQTPRLTELLIQAGANIHLADNYGRPVWWLALGRETRNVELIELFIRSGVDLNLRDRMGRSVIDYAADQDWWRSAYVLARLQGGGKDFLVGRERQSVREHLLQEVKSLQSASLPIPKDLARTLESFERAKR